MGEGEVPIQSRTRDTSVFGVISFSLSAWQWVAGIILFFQIQQMVLDGYLMTCMGWKDPSDRAGRIGMFSESESCERLLF